MVGKIRVMILCLAVLVVASLVCGLATNFTALFVARVIVGMATGFGTTVLIFLISGSNTFRIGFPS